MNTQPNNNSARRAQQHGDQFVASLVLVVLFATSAVVSYSLHSKGESGPFNIYLGGILAVSAFVYAAWSLHMHRKETKAAERGSTLPL